MGYAKTNDSYALMVNRTEVPAGQHVVICTAMAVAPGDEPRVFAAVTPDNDAVFAQLSIADGFGRLSLFERTNGTDNQLCPTQKISGMNAGEWLKLAICCGDRKITAMASNDAGEIIRCRGTSNVAGTRFGLGTGAIAEEVRFDNVRCLTHFPASCKEHPLVSEDGCPHCGQVCPCCDVDVHLN